VANPTAAASPTSAAAGPGDDVVGPYRSAVEPLDPVALGGWLVSDRRTTAPLRLVDCSPVVKIVVQAPPAGRLARQLGVDVGRAELFEDGFLAVCTAPGEWQLLCPAPPEEFVNRFGEMAPGEAVGVVDVTHGRTLLRLTGGSAASVLGRLTALDLSEGAFALGAACTTAVAGVRTCVVRDDLYADEAGFETPVAVAVRDGDGEGPPEVRSYLLCCDRSAGRYLHEQLLEAGRASGLAEEGYVAHRQRRADV
jgi:heterotetrameric sarcosine oxidase gamma subunit